MRFHKYHSLGNDFAIFFAQSPPSNKFCRHIREFSNRITGIGFDQLLWVRPSDTADFFFHIFNADGSEATQCLNGARCVARFLREQSLIQGDSVCLDSGAGPFEVLIHQYDDIITKMSNIPFKIENSVIFQEVSYFVVDVGNPHLVCFVPKLDKVDVVSLGKHCQTHYPNGINVGFAEMLSKQHIQLRSYERGSGLTLACGSNALATVLCGINQGFLQSPVTVSFLLGDCTISYSEMDKQCEIIGPAIQVYSDAVLTI